MKNEPIFQWDKDYGSALCILTEGNNSFVGYANCHPDDEDMMSEKTGLTIALYRAEIKFYQHIKNNEIKPQLKALKQVYYAMNRSKKFNPNSYENKMLQRQIHQLEIDLDTIKDLLDNKKETLRDYINEKEKLYQKIRDNRKGQK